MTSPAEYLLEEIAMLKEMVAAKEAELAAIVSPDAAPVGVEDEPPAKRRKLSHAVPKAATGSRTYAYRFGVRIPKKVPKAKTFGVVTTLSETMYDHVSVKDGRLYLMVADEAYPKTDVQVKHVVRSSKRPDTGKPRLFPMLDVYSKGVRVGTVRSKADLLRRLGVDVPKVYSCRKVAA